jgi:AGZA family xanthine/uracil permease-like MFS transporter
VLGGAGVGTEANPYRRELIDQMASRRNFHAEGMFALDQGYFFTCIILAAATVAIIDRQFGRAALWFLAGAALSSVGLIHAYSYATGDIVGALQPGWKWVAGYAGMAATMLVFPLFMVRNRDTPVI